ncbi:sugar transferase [Christiangramia echinicola]|uniref:Sugar transferase involved in LPS biosynthesis (Colanic, teichoic acid) n=1 Tax=Christiangramia echinicola TaxID=279359 RepID=A0A1H1QR35_9FLAO|nr:sugar transferase [Christiangramia echinicola]SDS25856.1 Sugar transferase involved in LPS biosynthesis (colanic, teichoic acid) [Christiangramia echinicola]
MYRKIIKPAIDFTVAFISLVIISPILLLIIILLSLANNGRPFFFQKRPGKFGRNFNIVKFKTMTDATDKNGNLLPDAERLTYIGKIVRKTSIDEIPQLFNVVKGDMSIIGPRPLLPEYLALYDEEQKKRHDVKPGITGWAQVNGRNAISWTQKFEYDIWYVENQSFILDFKILMKTIKKVLVSEGINTANMATTEPFNGNN